MRKTLTRGFVGLMKQCSQKPLEEMGTVTPRGLPVMWSPVEGDRWLTWVPGAGRTQVKDICCQPRRPQYD